MPRTLENTPLATCPDPTAQAVFDAVAQHARQMPRKCMAGPYSSCLYRGPDDNACFVGGLLTDDEAMGLDDPDQPVTVQTLANRNRLPARLVPHVDLLLNLQDVHDTHPQDQWSKHLAQVARDHNLTFTGA